MPSPFTAFTHTHTHTHTHTQNKTKQNKKILAFKHLIKICRILESSHRARCLLEYSFDSLRISSSSLLSISSLYIQNSKNKLNPLLYGTDLPEVRPQVPQTSQLIPWVALKLGWLFRYVFSQGKRPGLGIPH